MKLRSLVLVATLAISGLAVAQSDAAAAPSGNAPAATASAHARQSLGLSADQKQHIKSIRQSARDQAAVISHDASLTPAQRDEKLKALRQDTRQRVKAVLTPEQQQKAEQLKADRKQRVEAQLNLTPEQKTKMKETLSAAKQQREAVLNNSGLSQDEKTAQLKQIRENTKAQMSQILTPEQQQKLKHLRHGRKMRGMGA